MLIAGHLMLPAERAAGARGVGRVTLGRGWVRVGTGAEAGRIAAVGLGDPPGRPDVGQADGGSGDTVLCPGFVDTHLHLPQFDSVGADGMPLLEWLERVIFPAEAKWADADYAGAMAGRVAKKLLAHGTTAVGAYATVHHEGAMAAIRALADAGLRGVVGQVLMDQGAPAELVRPAGQLLKEAAAVRGAGRIEPAVTPRFAVSCSAGLLEGAGELARARGAAVQTHLSETPDECALVARLHGGASYTEVYGRAGLLGPRTILGHGIWLSDAERGLIARAGATVAHCPTANLFLEAGAMSLTAQTRAGVRVGLGSDVAGGPDTAMPRVARAMLETAKRLRMCGSQEPEGRGEREGAAEAWWRITAGNAAVLGLDGGGVLAAGAPADLVVLEPGAGAAGSPSWVNAADPLSALLYGWDERWIRMVMVAGAAVGARPG